MERSMRGGVAGSREDPDHRRSPRIRKVRPVAFSIAEGGGAARRTVSANVSRGGMLLVTRHDRFPPAGTAVELTPFNEHQPGAAIPGRIVYTRFSPRADLRFAGLKFEADLNDDAAALIGLEGGEDPVDAALKKLEELDGPAEAPLQPAPEASPAQPDDVARLRAHLDAAADELLAATHQFLSEWGEAYLRRTIADKHALARAKGAAGVGALKEEWRALQSDFPALIDAQINRGFLWPSREDGSSATARAKNPFYDMERDQAPPELVEELRKLLGFMGRILVRHGFDDLGDGSEWVPVAHENALVSYRGRLVLPDALREVLCRAARDYEAYTSLMPQINEAREEDARREALRLWDEA